MEQQTLFKIRDLRKKDQFKIDDKYLNGYARILGVYATVVYNSLCRHAEFYTQKAFPSEKLIAEEHNITERTVRNAIKKLGIANIIEIKKERSSRGQWLNNTYFLIDKLEWKKPEELNDLWFNQRNIKTQPEESHDTARGTRSAIKDNTLRRITNKKELATPSVAGKEISDLIELFKPVNPTYERLFANTTQRASLERLVKKFGYEKTGNLISYLPKIFGKPYTPQITTPYMLEQKLGDLLSFIQKKSEEKIPFIDFQKI